MKRRGFTLIELVVVVALLAILATLVVMGVGKLQTNSKRQQTRLLLQNLQNMFSEFDVNRRVPYGAGNLSPTIVQNLTGTIYLPCPQNVNLDYNNSAEASQMPTSGSGTPPPVAADRKGLDGNVVVPLTRSFMAQLMTAPPNAAAIGKMSSGSLMTFAGYDPLTASPTAWNMTTYYPVGAYVTDNNSPPNVYIRTQLNVDTSGNIQYDTAIDAPPNYYYWMPALRVPYPTIVPGTPGTALSTPVILDAWGNPIIFVMGGVLGANPVSYTLASGSNGNLYLPFGQGGMISSSGTTSAVKVQVHSPDYHPFFASAGPDGDFSKGDDNLYSFEK